MTTTIVLPVSRSRYLDKVITCLELLDCNQNETNIIAVVDGNDELYLRTRNLVNSLKFKDRLTVKSGLKGTPPNLDIPTRRKRICAIHNKVRDLINHQHGYVFLVEDDTTFGRGALERLKRLAATNQSAGMVMGLEIARWGVPYVGSWVADDIYNTKVLKSVDNISLDITTPPERVDAGGMFCTVVRADLYKNHYFHCENGLGPDVNFGLELRRVGYENFLVRQVQCTHYGKKDGKEVVITPDTTTKEVTLTKINDRKWRDTH